MHFCLFFGILGFSALLVGKNTLLPHLCGGANFRVLCRVEAEDLYHYTAVQLCGHDGPGMEGRNPVKTVAGIVIGSRDATNKRSSRPTGSVCCFFCFIHLLLYDSEYSTCFRAFDELLLYIGFLHNNTVLPLRFFADDPVKNRHHKTGSGKNQGNQKGRAVASLTVEDRLHDYWPDKACCRKADKHDPVV